MPAVRPGDLAGFAGGAVLGALTAVAVRRLPRRVAVVGLGGGLLTAAAIYPTARRAGSTADTAEVLTLAAGAALTAAAGLLDEPAARRLVAAGWASHGIFDALHGVRGDSRLPGWYPAMCAGYDVSLAAVVAAS